MGVSETKICPSDSKYIQIIYSRINEILMSLNWSEQDRFAVEISLDEAFMNAYMHGNKKDPTKKITVSYMITSQQITLSIMDEGNGFTPATVPDPRKDQSLTTPSGRGIFFIKNFMDDVFYNNKGNQITMRKVLRSVPKEAAVPN